MLVAVTWAASRSGGAHDATNGIEQFGEARLLLAKLTLAKRGDRVVASALVVRRLSPLRFDPSFLAHALEGRIERSLLHAEHVARESLDVLGETVAVHGLHGERSEDEHIERAREQLAFTGCHGVPVEDLGDRSTMAFECADCKAFVRKRPEVTTISRMTPKLPDTALAEDSGRNEP
jgi:hypothetical protein